MGWREKLRKGGLKYSLHRRRQHHSGSNECPDIIAAIAEQPRKSDVFQKNLGISDQTVVGRIVGQDGILSYSSFPQ
jgi:hypothetical protein